VKGCVRTRRDAEQCRRCHLDNRRSEARLPFRRVAVCTPHPAPYVIFTINPTAEIQERIKMQGNPGRTVFLIYGLDHNRRRRRRGGGPEDEPRPEIGNEPANPRPHRSLAQGIAVRHPPSLDRRRLPGSHWRSLSQHRCEIHVNRARHRIGGGCGGVTRCSESGRG
jgi:hypothetical protein